MDIKKTTSLLMITFVSLSLFAQSNYNEAIQQGDDAFKRSEYTIAIKKYLSAKIFNESKIEIVYAKLDKVYNAINAQQRELSQTKAELVKTKNTLAEVRQKEEPATAVTENNELEQLKTQLAELKQKLAEVTAQKKELENVPSDSASPKELAQIKEFTELLPQLSYGFLKKNFPKKVCKELKTTIPEGKTATQHLVDLFLKGNSVKKEKIINSIKSVLHIDNNKKD